MQSRRQSRTRRLALGTTLTALGVAAPWLGWAQTTESGTTAANQGLQEVVVTAQRRTEKLMDVPMSITALSQDVLDVKGLHNIDDLSRVAPGVTFLRNGMSASGNYNDEDSDISIRGIDSTAGASTTGIY
ncbi:MAG TPA: TonB-dependent receptor plug domain-containing protein, partial [Steroidobacteraceae bacterium]|nr:TonB-dependent receptor plug domain-containing protein [Steroidobacteraceae bacterium]